MPEYTKESLESIAEVIETIENALPKNSDKEIQSYKIFRRLLEVLHSNARGKVSFKAYYLASRRKAVLSLFDGSNQAEIAHTLGIPINVVKKDIAKFYQNKK